MTADHDPSPEIGSGVEPGSRPLRVGLLLDGRADAPHDEPDAAALRLAALLQADGHEVTLLEAGGLPTSAGPVRGEDRHSLDRAIRRVELPACPVPLASLSPQLALSYRVYLWLRDREAFDVFHFAERGGAGFYAMTARRLGLFPGRCAFVVGLFGSSAWRRRASGDIIRHESELERDFIERRSVEMADALWSPTIAPIDWARSRGWALPGSVEVRDLPGGDGDWPRWLRDVAGPTAATDDDRNAVGPPSISVCINHYNRPHYLRQALDSIVAQEYAPLEVIVVDDGSPGQGVQDELDHIVAGLEFERRGWRLVRSRDLYLGASRNVAAREARGDYILFMDDDNVAKPHELATFARAASRTGADVFTCLLDMFEGTDPPRPDQPPTVRHLFPGAALPLCAIRNTFGDSNALVRRRALMELGGYTEDRGVGHEDWEAYSKFALRGYRVEVIPEALFFYRTSAASMTSRVSVIKNHLRSLRPHLARIPEPYHPLIELAMGQLLARWGYLDRPESGGTANGTIPGGASAPAGPPLRYRVVDAINDRIKRLRPMHRLARRVLQGGWRSSRVKGQAG